MRYPWFIGLCLVGCVSNTDLGPATDSVATLPAFASAADYQGIDNGEIASCGQPGTATVEFQSFGQAWGYRVSLTSPGTIDVSLEGDPTLDTVVGIYGPGDDAGYFGETALVSDDSSGPGELSAIQGFAVPSSGTYFVLVTTSEGLGSGTVALTLSASCTAPGCTTSGDCDDGKSCASDECVGGACTHTSEPGCVEGGGNCYDWKQDVYAVGTNLTQGCVTCSCVAEGTWECTSPPDCHDCVTVDQCDDGDSCNQDSCFEGQCQYSSATIEGCCQLDAECDDGDQCTTDECSNGQCTHTSEPGCSEDAQCYDWKQDAYVVGTNVTQGCVTCSCVAADTWECTSAPDCHDCVSAAQCDDGDACNADGCFRGQCTYMSSTVAGCCESNGHCKDADPCTIDVCNGGQCEYLPSSAPECSSGGCFDWTQSLHPVGTNTTEGCITCSCVADDTWECTAAPDCTSCLTDAQCNDGDACNQDACVEGSCVFSSSIVPGCCESNADCHDSDPCTVDVCNGGQCQNFPSSVEGCDTAACADWKAAPHAVGTSMTQLCTTCTCVAADTWECTSQPGCNSCVSTSECDDGDPCTEDFCIDGECKPYAISGCEAPACASVSDCDDGDQCTTDECSNGQCTHTSEPGCSGDTGLCYDWQQQTYDIGTSTTQGCVSCMCIAEGTWKCTADPGCNDCLSAEQCDDGDPCTADSCLAGQCAFTAIPGGQCGEP